MAPEEWDPFTEAELEVAAQIATWLGADEWDRLPLDILACFVRGYAYRTDWADAAFAYLHRQIIWRYEEMAAVCRLDAPPPSASGGSRSCRPARSASTATATWCTSSAPARSRRRTCSASSTRRPSSSTSRAAARGAARVPRRQLRRAQEAAVQGDRRPRPRGLRDGARQADGLMARTVGAALPESIFKFARDQRSPFICVAWKTAKAFVHADHRREGARASARASREIRRTFDEPASRCARASRSTRCRGGSSTDGPPSSAARARHCVPLEGAVAPDLDLERMKGGRVTKWCALRDNNSE